MANNNKKLGTGYTNLQDIIGANSNNRLADTLVQGVSDTSQQARQKLDEAKGAFDTDLGKTTSATTQGKQFGTGLVNQADSTGNVSQDDTSKFINFQNSQYGGPSGLQNTDAARSKAQEAESLGKDTASSGGRMELLRRYGAAGTTQPYTQSRQNLDNLYLGGSEDKLRGARQQTQGLSNNIQTASNNADVQVQNAQTDLTGAKTGISRLLADRNAALSNSLNTQLQNTITDKNAKYTSLVNGNDDQLAQQLGLTHGNNYYNTNQDLGVYSRNDQFGVNPLAQTYFTNSADPTISNVASDQDKARLTALSQLAQQQSGLDPNATAYDPNKFYNFNKDQYNQDRGAGAQQFLATDANQYTPNTGPNAAPQSISDLYNSVNQGINQLKNSPDQSLTAQRQAAINRNIDIINKARAARGMDPIAYDPGQQLNPLSSFQ